jgi:uncharacterized membrane protein
MAKAHEHDDSFSKNRMESLTDGIFATVMTILILSLIVPIITGSDISGQLTSAIFSLFPSIVIYIFSFTVLLVMWIGHNNIFRYMHAVNPKLLWINGLFLLFIGIVPLSTALLGRYPLQQATIFFYAINFLILAVIFKLFYRYTKKSHATDSVLARTYRSSWLSFALYIGAIIFSFVNPYLSLLLFSLLPIFYFYQAFFGMYRELN